MRLRRTLAVLIALAAAPPATAQESPYHALTDADAARLERVLRAELIRTRASLASVAEVVPATEAMFGFTEEVRSGRVDPLEFTRARSRHVMVPPGARYDAACSRALAGALAVFTLGVTDDAAIAELQANAADQRAQAAAIFGGRSRLTRGPASEAADRAVRFYRERGFEFTAPRALNAHLQWGEPETDSLQVSVYLLNPYGDRAGCAQLPNGPVIVLGIEDAWTGSEPLRAAEARAAERAREGNDAMARALAETGLTEEAYDKRRLALEMARADASDLASLDQLAAIPDLGPMIAVRRANVAWLKRHEARLAPILAELDALTAR